MSPGLISVISAKSEEFTCLFLTFMEKYLFRSGWSSGISGPSASGGSPARILRQLLTESVLLSAIGGAAGILLALVILRAAPAWLSEDTLPVSMTLDFDARIAGFTLLATLLTGLLFGIAPTWQASRISLTDALRAAGRGFTGAGGAFRS